MQDTVRAVEVTESIVRLYTEDLRHVPDLHPSLRHLLPQQMSEPAEAADAEPAGIGLDQSAS